MTSVRLVLTNLSPLHSHLNFTSQVNLCLIFRNCCSNLHHATVLFYLNNNFLGIFEITRFARVEDLEWLWFTKFLLYFLMAKEHISTWFYSVLRNIWWSLEFYVASFTCKNLLEKFSNKNKGQTFQFSEPVKLLKNCFEQKTFFIRNYYSSVNTWKSINNQLIRSFPDTYFIII